SNGLLERGDYVLMTSSSLSSQDELVALRDNRVPMVVPVYDRLYGNGAQGAMHVARFAVVRLIAWKLTGASRSLTFALVGDDADYACFRHQQRATVGQTVTFTPTMPLTGGLAPGWRFGDGAASHALTATHAYSATGTFQVTLTVTNAWGVAASAQSRIVVDPALRVDFTPPAARFGQATAFHGAVGWGPPPAGVVTGTWDFGDGALAAGYNVTHTYASVGTYPVTFSATDRNGFTVSVRKPVTVAGERVWLPQAGRRSALTPPAPNPRRR
ncbi:MAG TPA: PKD domain-containing protein, partial [Herpetosiphonaceae bacterium]